MLQITDSAANVLQAERANQELPDSYGVRVFANADENGQAALAVAFAQEPAEGDQVSVQSGTEIYVAPEVAEPLAESALDVEETPEGPRLALVPQDGGEQ